MPRKRTNQRRKSGRDTVLVQEVEVALADNAGAKSQDLANQLMSTTADVRSVLLALEKAGKAHRVGLTKATRWYPGPAAAETAAASAPKISASAPKLRAAAPKPPNPSAGATRGPAPARKARASAAPAPAPAASPSKPARVRSSPPAPASGQAAYRIEVAANGSAAVHWYLMASSIEEACRLAASRTKGRMLGVSWVGEAITG